MNNPFQIQLPGKTQDSSFIPPQSEYLQRSEGAPRPAAHEAVSSMRSQRALKMMKFEDRRLSRRAMYIQ